MNPEIYLRIFWALLLVGIGMVSYWLLNRWLLNRARTSLKLERIAPGRAALVYFTSPDCSPCKTIQRPAIQRLREKMGDALQVIEIDAMAQPEIATQWGILSVPTTYILDPEGQPRYINHGVASYEQLSRQLASLSSGV